MELFSNHLAVSLPRFDGQSFQDNFISHGDLIRLTIDVDGQPCDILGTVIKSATAKEKIDSEFRPANEYIMQNSRSSNKDNYSIKNVQVIVKSRNYELMKGQIVDYEVKF